jgi:hypothetical protein
MPYNDRRRSSSPDVFARFEPPRFHEPLAGRQGQDRWLQAAHAELEAQRIGCRARAAHHARVSPRG